jgi:acyl dehydratase
VGVDPEALGLVTPPRESSWDSTDCLIYALGVGATDLPFATENTEGVDQQVLPTFPVVVSAGAWTMAELGDFDRAHLVHASQSLTLDGPVATEGRVRWTTTVTGIWDKGAAALIDTETVAVDAHSGTRCWTVASSVFIRGGGGWGGQRGPSTPPWAPPGPPEVVLRAPTRPDQALLYRLSGDRNPLHSDPAFAARAGFDRPILHGLCTYGITARLLLDALCDAEPARFVSLSGRFSQPAYPGDDLTVSVWRDDRPDGADLLGAAYHTATAAGIVIDRGRLTYRA